MDGDQIGARPAQPTNAALKPTRQLRAYAAIQSASDSTRREQRKAQISRTRARAGRSPSRATRPPGTDPGRSRATPHTNGIRSATRTRHDHPRSTGPTADPPLDGLHPRTDRQHSGAPRSPTRVTRCDRPNNAGRLPRTENPNPAAQPRRSRRAPSGRNSFRARSRGRTSKHHRKVRWRRSEEISPTRRSQTRTTNPTEKR